MPQIPLQGRELPRADLRDFGNELIPVGSPVLHCPGLRVFAAQPRQGALTAYATGAWIRHRTRTVFHRSRTPVKPITAHGPTSRTRRPTRIVALARCSWILIGGATWHSSQRRPEHNLASEEPTGRLPWLRGRMREGVGGFLVHARLCRARCLPFNHQLGICRSAHRPRIAAVPTTRYRKHLAKCAEVVLAFHEGRNPKTWYLGPEATLAKSRGFFEDSAPSARSIRRPPERCAPLGHQNP